MNRTETIQILAILKAAFPNAFKGMDADDREAMVILWQRMFANESYAEVAAAVDRLIKKREYGWTPSVGEVTAELSEGRKSQLMSENDAWLLVRKAARNGNYHADKEFAKLPPAVQAVIGGPWAIKEFANFSDEQMSKEERTFKKAYKEELERGVSYSQPQTMTDISSGLADKFKLGS